MTSTKTPLDFVKDMTDEQRARFVEAGNPLPAGEVHTTSGIKTKEIFKRDDRVGHPKVFGFGRVICVEENDFVRINWDSGVRTSEPPCDLIRIAETTTPRSPPLPTGDAPSLRHRLKRAEAFLAKLGITDSDERHSELSMDLARQFAEVADQRSADPERIKL